MSHMLTMRTSCKYPRWRIEDAPRIYSNPHVADAANRLVDDDEN